MVSSGIFDAVMALRPTVPAKDFLQSTAFYEALGFSTWPLGDGLSHVQIGDRDGLFCFLLQDAYAKEWAENAMMLLTVPQLDPWWEHICTLDLPGSFGIAEPIAPRLEPWGLRVAYFNDPSGVLWHIAEQDGFPEET